MRNKQCTKKYSYRHLFFFLFWGGTRSLRIPALRPASQAGPVRNPREGTSVVLWDTIRLTWWCVLCSCCATSPHFREVCRAKGEIGSGETLCHDIYPARPITTVSLAANTYCMMDGHSSCAPHTVGPRVQFSSACEQSHWWLARNTAGGHLLSVVEAVTNTERL